LRGRGGIRGRFRGILNAGSCLGNGG
jgi:hypothetical protein